MHLAVLRVCHGLPHSLDGHRLIASRGARIIESSDLGETWTTVGRVPGGVADLHLRLRPAERLLRRSVSHALRTAAGSLIAIANGAVWRRAPQEEFVRTFTIQRGSRPLHRGLCSTSRGELYLGEYFSNSERAAVHIWRSVDDGRTWEVAHTLPPGTVRHVHAIQEDACEPGTLWVLCGDLGEESRILRSTDGLRTVEVVAKGGQVARATALLFMPDAVYYGMDSPLEASAVQRLERGSWTRIRLTELDGPAYYAFQNEAGGMLLGTTVEPGPAVADDCARIWASGDGTNWEVLTTHRADRWPIRWFQYGCYYFPDGIGRGDTVVYGAVGLRGVDGRLLIGRLVRDR